jgi:hypothetical protein
MAEFILYWKAHHMDAWDKAKVDSLSPNMKAKYDRRYQKGDIVEVWPDGEGEWRVKGNPQFAVVKVPGLKADSEWMRPQEFQSGIDAKGNPVMTMLKRRKWSFSNIKKATEDELNATCVATLNDTDFLDARKAKT